MQFSRRGFLKALIAGSSLAAAAAVAGTPALAQGNRYQRLINAQLTIKGFNRIKKNAGYEQAQVQKRAQDAINRNMSNLLGLLDTEFNGRADMEADFDGMQEKVKAIFNRELVVDTMSETDLRRYENTIISIATMRYLLAHERATFDPRECPHWSAFAELYRDVIIGA